MHTFLFLDLEASRLKSGEDRIVQLCTRLVTPNGSQDHHQRFHTESLSAPIPPAPRPGVSSQTTTVRKVSTTLGLKNLCLQLKQADIIIGHNIAQDITTILAEAQRTGHHAIIKMLTHPHFGLDGGERAAICTQQIASDYLRFLDESPSGSNTKLTTIYRRLFGHELPDDQEPSARTIACQRVYGFLSAFKLEHENEFLADIVFFEE